MTAALPDYIAEAIQCGLKPILREWQTLPLEELTVGEMVLRFAADHLVFPEGKKIGQPLILDPFQQAFILSVFDSDVHVDKAILSMARRGGKTLIMAVILLAFLVGPLAQKNTLIRSAAMTRDQAGLIYRLMALICDMSPDLSGLYRTVPSLKKIIGLNRNVEYQSLSRDAKAGHGQAIYVLVLDEAGQIEAPQDEFLDMLFSSLGTYDDSRVFIISTQAPSDVAFLSLEIDTAIRDQPKNTVCHLYTAASNDLHDENNWYAANPSLYGGYRSLKDLKNQIDEADRIPAKQNGVLNLIFNRRVSRQSLWMAPSVWKANAGKPDWEVFKHHGVHIGLDLSQKHDLTVATMCAEDDDGIIHCYPYAFSPQTGLKDRERRDKVPYTAWANQKIIFSPPGVTVDYEWVAEFLALELKEKGIDVLSVQFDRWRIVEFKAASLRKNFAGAAKWNEVGQGYQSMSPRLEAMETALLQERIRHGGHPVFNLAAAHAIVTKSPAGDQKLDKAQSRQKIDGLVSLIMAAYPLISKLLLPFDPRSMVG